MSFGKLDFSKGLTLFEIQAQLKSLKMVYPITFVVTMLEESVESGDLRQVVAIGGHTTWEVAN